MSNLQKVFGNIGFITVLVFGIFAIPKIMKKCTGKIYKNNHEDIDFDELGPKIVKKTTEEEIK